MTRRRVEFAGYGLAVLLAWLVLLPLWFVVVEGVRGPDGPTLEAVRRFLVGGHEWRAVTNSLVLSLLTVSGAALLGVPLAILVTRVECPGRRVAMTLLSLPAVLPPLVGVIGFLFL